MANEQERIINKGKEALNKTEKTTLLYPSQEKMMKNIKSSIMLCAKQENKKTIMKISLLEYSMIELAIESGFIEKYTKEQLKNKTIKNKIIKTIKKWRAYNLDSYWKGYYKALEEVKELLK